MKVLYIQLLARFTKAQGTAVYSCLFRVADNKMLHITKIATYFHIEHLINHYALLENNYNAHHASLQRADDVMNPDNILDRLHFSMQR